MDDEFNDMLYRYVVLSRSHNSWCYGGDMGEVVEITKTICDTFDGKYRTGRNEYGEYTKQHVLPSLSEDEAIEKIITDNDSDIVAIVEDWSSDKKRFYRNLQSDDFIIQILKDKRINTTAVNNFTFKWSLRNGYTDVTYYLLKQPEVIELNGATKLFEDAFFIRSYRVATHIINNFDVDPSFDNNLPIRYAIDNCHHAFADAIIMCDKFDPSINSFTIISTIIANNKEIYFHMAMSKKTLVFDGDILGEAISYNRNWGVDVLMKNGSAIKNISQRTRMILVDEKILPSYNSRKVNRTLITA